jgi:hypothetical protein
MLVRAIDKHRRNAAHSDRIPTWEVLSGRRTLRQARRIPAFALVSAYVEPPAGIEPATPSLPWNHQEPLCGPSFPQVTPDRRGQSYRFSFDEVMRSLSNHAPIVPGASHHSCQRS